MTKTNYVYLGEMRLMDYPLVIISESRETVEQKLVKEWANHAKQNGSDAPFTPETVTFNKLEDWLEVSIRQIEMDQVEWP